MRALSDLSKLVYLNILTLIFCLPVVTAGASLAAMHYVIMEMIEERGGTILSEFWKRFRQNLRSATPIWLILLAAGLFLYGDFRLIEGGQAGIPKAMLIPVMALAVILMAISVYVIPLTARFEYTTGGAFRNAAILAVAYLPRTLLMMVIMTVIPYILLNVTRLLPLFFLLGISLPSYLCALVYLPVFKKMAGEEEAAGEDEWHIEDQEGDPEGNTEAGEEEEAEQAGTER